MALVNEGFEDVADARLGASMINQSTATTIDARLLTYYVKLRDHRCGITEGIRVIAFRNVDHLSRCCEELGIANASDEASRILVQNKMLEDQGLEKTDSNRWLLGLATWVPWEIYMCLLYAEIEHYMTISQKHTALVYAPLQDYLASHQALVQALNEVRHKLLHPLKETAHQENLWQFNEDAKRAAPDTLSALVALQNLIDDYLEWFRALLRESLADEISKQSDEEIFEFNRRHVDRMTNLIAKSKSAEAKAATRKLLDGWQESDESLALVVEPDFVLNASQRRRVAQWEKTMHGLALPLPERPYPKSRDSVQTAIHRELSSFIPAPPIENQPAWTGQALPEYIQQNRSGFIDLLFRSLIIFNEPYTAIVADFESRFPGRSRADIVNSPAKLREFVQGLLPLETGKDYEQAELRTSPSIVASALLAEPLSEYRRLVSHRPELRHSEIDERITGDELATYSRFRNAVFHVPDDRTDFFKASEEFHGKSPFLSDYRELVGGLFKFYLRNPADGSPPEAGELKRASRGSVVE